MMARDRKFRHLIWATKYLWINGPADQGRPGFPFTRVPGLESLIGGDAVKTLYQTQQTVVGGF